MARINTRIALEHPTKASASFIDFAAAAFKPASGGVQCSHGIMAIAVFCKSLQLEYDKDSSIYGGYRPALAFGLRNLGLELSNFSDWSGWSEYLIGSSRLFPFQATRAT